MERMGHLYDIVLGDLKVVPIVLSLIALLRSNYLTSNYYGSTARDLISLFVTNQWLLTTPIIKPSKFAYTEVDPCQLLGGMVSYRAKPLRSQHFRKPWIFVT